MSVKHRKYVGRVACILLGKPKNMTSVKAVPRQVEFT